MTSRADFISVPYDGADERRCRLMARIRQEQFNGTADDRRVEKGDALRIGTMGNLAELAWSRYAGRVWDGGLFSDRDAPRNAKRWDVCGVAVRATDCASGHLIIQPYDREEWPYVLGIVLGDRVLIAGHAWAADVKRRFPARPLRPDARPSHNAPVAFLRPAWEVLETTAVGFLTSPRFIRFYPSAALDFLAVPRCSRDDDRPEQARNRSRPRARALPRQVTELSPDARSIS